MSTKKINSKKKGNSYEREVAALIREHGFTDARRTAQYCGKTEESSDVVGLPGIHIECKRYAAKAFDYKWLEQAEKDCNGKLPVVFHRTDRHKTLVTMDADTFFLLYKEAQIDLQKLD